MPCRIEREPQRRDAAVVHVARRDAVRTSRGVGECEVGQSIERSRQVLLAMRIVQAAMTISRVAAEAGVEPQARILAGAEAKCRNRLADESRIEIACVLACRHREEKVLTHSRFEVGIELRPRSVLREAQVAREPRDRTRIGRILGDEERLDQLALREAGLGDEIAQGRRAAKTLQAAGRCCERVAA